jgi:hypothetical protein
MDPNAADYILFICAGLALVVGVVSLISSLF